MIKDLAGAEAGRWLEAAPQPVQEAVTQGLVDRVIESVGQKYTLHVDVVGNLQKLTAYLLIGYVNPQQFLEELVANGMSREIANKIIEDINLQIFKPLQEKIRSGTSGSISPGIAVPAVPLTPVIAQPPKAMPVNAGLAAALAKAGAVSAPANLPGAPANLLEDHEEPHIPIAHEPSKSPAPSAPPMIVRTIRSMPASETVTPSPAPKKYDSDPYREPFDDK